ncbi:MAG: hypothetical protein AAGA54_02395 [Myxococcota bacterium]
MFARISAPLSAALLLAAGGCSTSASPLQDAPMVSGGDSTGGDESGNDTTGDIVTTGISASASASVGSTGTTSDTDGDPSTTGAPCDGPDDCPDMDGNPCTVSSCQADGTCLEAPLDCDSDQNECADATCNPRTGACEYTANDDACAGSEACGVSTCDLQLEDDGTFIAASCQSTPQDGDPCDDGDACTADDACDRGACVGGVLQCDDAPAPACEGNTLNTYGVGLCSAGECEYQASGVQCPDGCSGGACQGPGHPLISEVLYDSEGNDTDVWIEVWAPPGSSLAGYTLEAVNGSGGGVYDSLSLSGTVPSDGLFLIVNGAATEAALLSEADLVDDFADLQNGPDNLRIRQGGTTVDALGYGNFGGAVFDGEGSSTPDASPDRSVARVLSVIDTDDNAADFVIETEPTPGAINH